MEQSHANYLAGTYPPGQWRRIARAVRRRDRFRCHRCGARVWIAHHRHYDHLYNEEACAYCCLETVCDDCHRAIHGRDWAPTDAELEAMIRGLP